MRTLAVRFGAALTAGRALTRRARGPRSMIVFDDSALWRCV